MRNNNKYTRRENLCIYTLRKIFCCSRRKILYDEFMNDVEKLLDDNTERINTAIQTDESNFGEEQNQEALDLGGGLKVQTI